MAKRGLKLITDIRELSKDKVIFTPTGTMIQDKEFYLQNLENYFKRGKIESKWIEILEQIKTKLENDK